MIFSINLSRIRVKWAFSKFASDLLNPNFHKSKTLFKTQTCLLKWPNFFLPDLKLICVQRKFTITFIGCSLLLASIISVDAIRWNNLANMRALSNRHLMTITSLVSLSSNLIWFEPINSFDVSDWQVCCTKHSQIQLET